MLTGRTAIVTGSTSGIGLAIAKALAAKGCNIVVNSFSDTTDDHAVAAGLQADHDIRAVYIRADMSKGEECRSLIDQALAQFGTVDILVNNAGIQYVSPVESFPVDKWDAILAINLTSNFHTSAAVIPHMRENGWGRIVNIASAHGLSASVEKSAYVAAKHGVVGLTKTIALELAGKGVTCNAVCPGFVLTPLVERQIEEKAGKDGTDHDTAMHAMLAQKQPSLEFATVEQIGAAVAFLCSEDAAQITGTTLSVDGGWTAQ